MSDSKSLVIHIRLGLLDAANLVAWLRKEGITSPSLPAAAKTALISLVEASGIDDFSSEEDAAAYLSTVLERKPRLEIDQVSLKKQLHLRKGDGFDSPPPQEKGGKIILED
jgi:hypothetical protein